MLPGNLQLTIQRLERFNKPPFAVRRAYASPEAYEGRCGVAGRLRVESGSDGLQETKEFLETCDLETVPTPPLV